MKNITENTPSNATPATTAVVLWDDAAQARVRELINKGESVPKGLMKIAPKAFVQSLRANRKAELQKNTASVLGGFTDRGFKVVACTPITTQKSGVQVVTLKLATPKPTAKMSLEEYAAQNGQSVADVLAALEMNAPAPTKNAK